MSSVLWSTASGFTISSHIPPQTSGRAENLLVGCILAVCGNIVISISLNLQKYTHLKVAASPVDLHYTRLPLWWLGLFLMAVGEVGNFSAYGFAPASLVAPLGTTTVIANLLIAAAFLKERIRPQHIFGSTLGVVGAILIVTFSSETEKILDGEEIQENLQEPLLISYMCVELVLLAVLFYLLYGRKLHYVVNYLLITSLLASFTVMSAKGVSGMLQLSVAGWPQFRYPIFYIMLIVMIATALLQVKYLNQAMRGYDATVVVPTNFVFFTISAILAGIIFYKEFHGMHAANIFIFLFGCLMCFIGVYFITARRTDLQPVQLSSQLSGEESETYTRQPILRTLSQISTIIPSWMTASINTSPVQPGPSSVTLRDDDDPLLQKPLRSDSSDEESYTPSRAVVGEKSLNRAEITYGSMDPSNTTSITGGRQSASLPDEGGVAKSPH